MSKKEDNKYEKLISYFKYLVTVTGSAITIIVAVALYFTYNNLSELRNEVRESSIEYKETIKEFNDYAQNAIDQTQNQTNKQISLISTEAKQLALTAAKEKIEQTFESENINKLIEDAAERKLENEIDLIVNKKLSDANKIIDEQLNIIPNLILYTDNVRQGDRKAFEFLDSLYRNTNNEKIKELTKNIIAGKTKDYDEAITMTINELKFKSPFDLLLGVEKNSIINQDTSIMINNLIDYINKSSDLNEIANSFYILRHLGVDIQTFDFQKLKEIENK
jgi:hypothetical protein